MFCIHPVESPWNISVPCRVMIVSPVRKENKMVLVTTPSNLPWTCLPFLSFLCVFHPQVGLSAAQQRKKEEE